MAGLISGDRYSHPTSHTRRTKMLYGKKVGPAPPLLFTPRQYLPRQRLSYVTHCSSASRGTNKGFSSIFAPSAEHNTCVCIVEPSIAPTEIFMNC